MPSAGVVSTRYYAAFNARDFDAYRELLDPDVEVVVDAHHLRGRDAAIAYAKGSIDAFPGVLARVERLVAETDDTVVNELRLVNPAADEPGEPWFLAGVVCEILEVRSGRVAAVRSYYSPHPDDRTDAAPVPSRSEARLLAHEQAALRRVAELIASGAADPEVFDAIVGEASELLGRAHTGIARFEEDGSSTVVAARGAPAPFAVGDRARFAGDGIVRRVRASGSAARVDAYAELDGEEAERAQAAGIVAAAGAPVLVDGRPWGVLGAAGAPLPAGSEERLEPFARLAGVAVAGSRVRSDLRRLADEQAALRRVAELVARGGAPGDVLDAVADEASRLLGRAGATLVRFDPDEGCTVVASCGGPRPAGTSWTAQEGELAWRLRRTGVPRRVTGPGGPAAGAPIAVGGKLWGMLAADAAGAPLPAGTEHVLGQFADLAAAAIAGAEARAQLLASRARVIATADDTRRRLQRDVHDGAQQRLVQTVLALRLATSALEDAPQDVPALVREGLRHAEQATEELRDLVRGILPASLTRGGLRAGVESLVSGLPMPVDTDVTAPRLPPELETTAYFIVAEALTNVVKHSGAATATVAAHVRDRRLHLEIRDDGAGGVDAAQGSGIAGMSDRIAARNGTLDIVSPAGGGTRVTALLPLPAPAGAP